MTKTILITGATGNISSGIITQLKGSEHRLLALVRTLKRLKSSSDRVSNFESAIWRSRGRSVLPSQARTSCGSWRHQGLAHPSSARTHSGRRGGRAPSTSYACRQSAQRILHQRSTAAFTHSLTPSWLDRAFRSPF